MRTATAAWWSPKRCGGVRSTATGVSPSQSASGVASAAAGSKAFAIAPGATETAMFREIFDEATVPRGDVLDPADVILGRGDFFGEMALLEDAPRKVSVVSEGFTDLLTLFTKDFRTLLARHPELKSEIEAVARDRA